MEPDGLSSWVSAHEMTSTVERLHRAIAEHGMTVFAEIDHAAAAAAAGLTLRPMRLLLFGNAAAGTKLMQRAPTIGIDLPLRALVWTDDEESIWLAYNDPGWLAARHGARQGNDQVLASMRTALTAIAETVTRRDG